MDFFKKHDIIVYSLVLVALICSFFIWGRSVKGTGAFAVVSVKGVEQHVLALNENTEITVKGYAGLTCTICIKDGSASITEADCPDKLCKKHEPVSREGESIICLPARITVTIRSDNKSDIDSVAR